MVHSLQGQAGTIFAKERKKDASKTVTFPSHGHSGPLETVNARFEPNL